MFRWKLTLKDWQQLSAEDKLFYFGADYHIQSQLDVLYNRTLKAHREGKLNIGTRDALMALGYYF
ncbi:hypothetical protein G4Y79_05240 [Phototrophicus methaneseepsis]|uniref:Uncharacterized protein n=1 Tax=Phototrophicus methaneseepsis TaxID=2710758 RepID=A0A7S8EB89_9CHLR|nr:hypothetical protein [Phototrophicus methaneseepsis]QPC83785.1 hypothetical protein G4Y79_05240 [Phototrophicus methaneseepsis]